MQVHELIKTLQALEHQEADIVFYGHSIDEDYVDNPVSSVGKQDSSGAFWRYCLFND